MNIGHTNSVLVVLPRRNLRDNPRSPLECNVTPQPIRGRDDPISEADKKIDMSHAPKQPTRKGGEPKTPNIHNCRAPSDRRQVTLMPIVKWAQRLTSKARSNQPTPRSVPFALRPARVPGTGRPPLCTDAASPTTKISGCVGNDRSGSTVTRPARSCSAPSQVATGEATTPAAQIITPASMLSSGRLTPRGPQPITGREVMTSTPFCESA
jgi:hypothetical protein